MGTTYRPENPFATVAPKPPAQAVPEAIEPPAYRDENPFAREADAAQAERGRLEVSTARARHANVGAMSEAFGLAQRTGLPLEVVAGNLDAVRARAGDADFDPATFQRDHPVTARWLTSETNAALSKDDWANLGTLERLLGQWEAPTLTGAVRTLAAASGGFGALAPALATSGLRQTQRGLLQAEYAREANVAELGRIGAIPPSQRTPELRALQAELEAMRNEVLPDPTSTLERFARGSAKIAPSLVESIEAGGVGAGVGAVVGGAIGSFAGGVGAGPGALFGAKVGGGLNAFFTVLTMEGGNAALQFERIGTEEGTPVDEDLAYSMGMAYGVAAGAVELVGLRFVLAPFGALARPLIQRAAGKVLARATTRSALTRGATAWARAVAGETATETVQQGLQLAAEQDVRTFSNWFDDTALPAIPLERVGRELTETAIETAIGMTLLALPGGGVSLVDGMGRAAEATRAQERLTMLGEGAKASQLRERAPEAFRELLAQDLDAHGPVQHVFVPVERLTVLLQEQGLTPAQFLEQAHVDPTAYEQALTMTGADLAIPLADYTAYIAGSELHTALLPDLKLRVGALSAREAEAEAATLEADAEALRTEMAAAAEATPEDASAQRVVEDLTAKLTGAGVYTAEQVQQMVRVAAAPYLVLAKRTGQDPFALYQSRNLQVFGPERATALYDVTRALQAAEAKGATPDELGTLRQRLNALSDERVTIRAALEVAEQTTPVRDEQGRLKRSLRDVSTEALVVEYIALRDQVTRAQGELAAFEEDPAFHRAMELASVGRMEEAQGAFEDAAGSGAVWSFDEMARTLRESRTLARRYERSVPRLAAELEARGIPDPDTYAAERDLLADASFDVESFEGLEQARETLSARAGQPRDVGAATRAVTVARTAAEAAPDDATAAGAYDAAMQDLVDAVQLDRVRAAEGAPGGLLLQEAEPTRRERALAARTITELRRWQERNTQRARAAGSRVAQLRELVASGEATPADVDALTEAQQAQQEAETAQRTAIDELVSRAEQATAEVAALRAQLAAVGEQRDVAVREANTDAMTGLPNRRAFDLAKATAEADPTVAFIRFDANGFKRVNDTLGHEAGDQLIQDIGTVVRAAAAPTGRAFRVGGDEFVLIVPTAEAEAVRDRAVQTFGVREIAPGVKTSISGGIGQTDAEADVAQQQQGTADKQAQGIPPSRVDAQTAQLAAQVERVRAEMEAALGPDALLEQAGDDARTEAMRTVEAATPARVATTFADAATAAQAFLGQPLTNATTGLEATVSKRNLGKMLSGKAAKQSADARSHALAVANADQLFQHAVLDRTHPDRAGEPTIAGIHRYVAPMLMPSGDVMVVKLTVKETTSPKKTNPLYTIETVDVERPAPVSSETEGEREAGQNRASLRAGLSPENVRGIVARVKTAQALLEQGGRRSRPNAFILPGREQQIIGLLETANLSSFLHEMAHEYLNLLATIASAPDAPAAVRADLATALEALGVASVADLGTAQQEQWARGFEAYLMSGQAPSVPLARAFTRFRIWLTDVYRRAKAALVPISPELRGVFDRLVATEEEIAAAQAETAGGVFFETAEEAQMTPAEFAAYQATYALRDADASAHLAKQLLAEQNAERRAAWEEREAEVRERVTEEVDGEPVEQAVVYLKSGRLPDGTSDPAPVKLAKAALVPLYGDGITKTLPRGTFSRDGGVDADAIAHRFGFASGDALVDALQRYEPRTKRIERLVQQRMRDAFPDLLGDSPALASAAQQALHLADTDNALLADLKALGRAAGIRPPNVAAFKRVARDIIGGTAGRDLRPSRFLNAEASAGRKAYEAMRRGDRTQAAFFKRQQLMNHILYREATRAEAHQGVILRFARRMETGASQARLGKAGQAYQDAMNALLDEYEFRRVSGRALDRRASLLEWIAKEQAAGIEVTVPANVLKAANARNFRQLTVDELDGVYETMQQLWHTATMKDQLLAAQAARSFAETRDGILAGIEAHRELVPRLYQPDKSIMEKLGKAFDGLHGLHLPPEMLFRILDGDQPNGPVHTALFEPAAAAQHEQTVMLRGAAASLQAIFESIPAARRKGYLERRIQVPGVSRRITGMTAYVLALNWGNEQNRLAILNSQVDGQQVWTPQQVDAVLSTLSAAEWRAVQQTWDFLNSYWPAIAELQRVMTGVVPEKVEAAPFVVKSSDGEILELKGGYYPLKYDTEYSWAAWANDQVSLQRAAEGQAVASYTRAATRHGHTEERVGSGGRPVLLNLSVLPNHVLNVIHDLTHRRAVYDIQRLILDPEIRAAIEQTAGPAVYKSLGPWVRRLAGEQQLPTNLVESILTHARTGTTVVNLGLKLTTALLQPIGITMSADLIGVKWARRGATAFLRNPVKLTQLVRTLSAEMESRASNFDRDVRDSSLRKGTLKQKDSAFFYLIAVADQIVSVSTWWGAYQKSMELQAPGDQEAAVRAADAAVRLSQGAGAAKDLSVAQSGTPLWRLFNLFYSYGKALYGMFYRSHKNLQEGRWGKGRFIGSLFAIWVLPAVLEPLMASRGPDEDDDQVEWWAWRLALYPFQAVIGVRDVARAIAPDAFGFELTPIGDAFTSAIRSVKAGAAAAADAITGGDDDEFTRAELKAFVEAVGYWGHLPTRQMWITGEYLYDWMMGYEDPETPVEAGRNLAFPRRSE